MIHGQYLASQENAEMLEKMLMRGSKAVLARAIADYEGVSIEEAIRKIEEGNRLSESK